MKIGVFDSGIGGVGVAKVIKNLAPCSEIIVINDRQNAPYGNRPDNEIISLSTAAIKPLVDKGCDIIVIACNTATTVAISSLRATYPNVNFIGIEPMIKPAANYTKTGHIAVCATSGTLRSERYKQLKNTWANNTEVIEPDCSSWAGYIENGQPEKINVEKVVHELINKNVDTIVLGCTHYHLIKERIAKAAGPNVTIFDPSDIIAERVNNLICLSCSQH